MTSITEILKGLAALPANWHGAGCLEMPNLEGLARHASTRKIRRSVETGTGKSTLLLSHLSEHHLCFSLDDAKNLQGTLSLQRAASSALLKPGVVEFVVGPSQKTLLAHTFSEPLQLAFIDGPHGYPFPELEYFKLYPHIEKGGLLVVDDIHIPTIRNLFNFLSEDPMWSLLETVGKTAFFERTDAPTFSPYGDGWWLQPYNKRRFPVPYKDLSSQTDHDEQVFMGSGETERNQSVYRKRLLPLILSWMSAGQRVAIFGTGAHTEFLWTAVPELWRLNIVAYLDSRPEVTGAKYRNVAVQTPDWVAGNADVVLCSSFEHELTQMALLDMVPVKVVLSHPVTALRGELAAQAKGESQAA
jgi:hypothetical protein